MWMMRLHLYVNQKHDDNDDDDDDDDDDEHPNQDFS